jgi:hypothetical protein
MKKPASKKLRLDIESVRILASDDLRDSIGGGRPRGPRPGQDGTLSDAVLCSGVETCALASP